MLKRNCFIRFNALVVCATLCAAFTCGNGTDSDNPSDRKQLTLITPLGGPGDTVRVGDTVEIRWSVDNTIPGCEAIWDVGVVYYLDTLGPYGIRGYSFPIDTTSYSWIVDAIHVSNQFVIKIYDYNYNSDATDQSDPFVVVAP